MASDSVKAIRARSIAHKNLIKNIALVGVIRRTQRLLNATEVGEANTSINEACEMIDKWNEGELREASHGE